MYSVRVNRYSSKPFLSVVTRHLPERKLYLSKHSLSLLTQSCSELEHIILTDSKRSGLLAANQALAKAVDLLSGEYVFIMDDDNRMVDADLVRVLKENSGPDVLLFKTKVGDRVIPERDLFGKMLIRKHIDSHCYAVKRDIWIKYIKAFGVARAGDFFFIKEVLEHVDSVKWIDIVACETMMIGNE